MRRLSAALVAIAAAIALLALSAPSWAAQQPLDSQPTSGLAVWAGLFASLALLMASIVLTTRRRNWI